MKIIDLRPGQQVQILKKNYTYEGIKKVRGKIGTAQKIVFTGEKKDDQKLYSLSDGTRTLESENIIIVNIN